MTCRLSSPGWMIFKATRRWTGFSCSAMNTTPMPPSPIFCRSLYGPMSVPGPSVSRGKTSGSIHWPGRASTVAPSAPAGLSRRLAGWSWACRSLSRRAQIRLPGAGSVEEGSSGGGIGLCQGQMEQRFFVHGRSPDWATRASVPPSAKRVDSASEKIEKKRDAVSQFPSISVWSQARA